MVYLGGQYKGNVPRDACVFAVGVEEQGEDDRERKFERGTLDPCWGERLHPSFASE